MTDHSQKIRNGVIREFVIPVKKHLAKFMLADDLKFEEPENLRQIIYYKLIDASDKWHTGFRPGIEIDYLVQYLYKECILKRNWFVSAEYYRKRNFSVEHRLFPYLDKNYTFLKIKVKVSTNTYAEAQSTYFNRLTFKRAVSRFNRMINNYFIDICSQYANCQPNRTEAIEEILFRLKIKPADIKKESIIRTLIRERKFKSKYVNYENLIKFLTTSLLQNIKTG